MIRLLMSILIVAASVSADAAQSFSDEEISEFGGCYFAPMTSAGLWRMRTQDGEIREFEVDADRKNTLVGAGGWRGTLQKEGVVSVHAPENKGRPPVVYNFANGKLASLDVEGRHCRFNYSAPLVYDDGAIFPLWPDVKEMTREEFSATTRMWKDGRRLKLWFSSPNQAGTFLSFIFLTLVGLAFSPRCVRWLRFLFMVLSLAAFSAIIMTASRGALAGVSFGVVAMAACDRRIRGFVTWRRLACMLPLCALLVAGAVAAMYSSGRDRHSDVKSDATRKELYSAALMMMRDAPWGWGGFNAVGRAYSDWYAPETEGLFRLNLVSDHLTVLAGNGWFGGSLYLLVWFAGLSALAIFASRGGSGVPLGIWVSLGVAASFNVIMFASTMLWMPLCSLAVLVFDRRWLHPRVLASAMSIGVAATGLCLASLLVAGCRIRPFAPAVSKDGSRTLINGESPAIWIVDDGESIGGALAPRDIRAFYRKFPGAPAVGYVKDFSDLPEEGVKRLVLVGDSAQYFMVPYTRKSASVRIPEEIVFLSPQFPPSRIPDDLRRKSKVIMVIGEFAARYWEEFTDPPDWVEVVGGAEVYIPWWMSKCVEACSGGRVK